MYTVGKYNIVPPKPFLSLGQAVEYIQYKYPELDKETIQKFLNPKITENGDNQSGNVSEENTAGKKNDSEISAASSKGIKSNADKPGQSTKG